MSPEQAQGQQTDYRSDQFSFGLILYEMAFGKPAFAKPSSVETMAAIVREEPLAIEEKVPAPLKWIIDGCLHKEPEQRCESTRDLFHELKNLREHFSESYTSGAFNPAATSKVKAHSAILRTSALWASCIALTVLLVYALKPSGQNIANYRYTRSPQIPMEELGLQMEKPSLIRAKSTERTRLFSTTSTRRWPLS